APPPTTHAPAVQALPDGQTAHAAPLVPQAELSAAPPRHTLAAQQPAQFVGPQEGGSPLQAATETAQPQIKPATRSCRMISPFMALGRVYIIAIFPAGAREGGQQPACSRPTRNDRGKRAVGEGSRGRAERGGTGTSPFNGG